MWLIDCDPIVDKIPILLYSKPVQALNLDTVTNLMHKKSIQVLFFLSSYHIKLQSLMAHFMH
jgi:hypothetical protein